MDNLTDVLCGSRCRLRALHAGDATALAANADDEGVRVNLFEGFPHPYTRAEAEWWCGEGCHEPQYGWVWGIEVDGAIAGCIGLAPQAGWLGCNAEVGYWLGRLHWGRGIASEALALVSDWAWRRRPELTRLFAPIFARNRGSQRVAEKCGYTLEATMPRSAIKDGRVIDQVQYALYRPNCKS